MSIETFQDYIKEKMVHKKIIELRNSNTDELFDLSIFPNGNFYDMSGYNFEANSDEIWDLLYRLAKNGKLASYSSL